MASMSIVYRPSSKGARHTGGLYLRLIHNRKVKTLILKGYRIYGDEWDKQSKTILFPENSPDRIAYLKEVKAKISEESKTISSYILSLESKGRYMLDDLIGLYRKEQDDSTLQGFTEELTRKMADRNQRRTVRAYETVVRGLVDFNKGENIPLEKINACLIKDFEMRLREKGRLPNTISYYMRNLRAIYNKAIAEKRIQIPGHANPFANVFTGVVSTMKRALSLDELKALQDLNLEEASKNEVPHSREQEYLLRLYTSQRYFFFCLYARGLCFVDLAYLKKSNIKGEFIRYIRQKTGQLIEVRIIPQLQSIISSFAGETAASPYLFPIIQNPQRSAFEQYESALRVQNKRLKKVAEMAGISQNISTHCARHTWATVGKLINLPINVIRESLGHTSVNTTLIYLAQLNNSVLDEANERIITTISNYKKEVPVVV